MIVFAALIGAAVLLLLCSLNWRLSVKAALYVVVLEGALRKWVLPEASELIYFLKDGILLGAYAGYLRQQPAPFRALMTRGGMLGLLTATVVILFFQVPNPALNSTLVGLLGVKGYLFYVPLAFLLPDLFRSTEELHRFLRWYVLFSIPVGLLGVAQFFAPSDSPINVYAPSEVETEVVVFEDGNVRITGTFPFLAGFAAYLTLIYVLVFALIIHQRLCRWWLGFAVVLSLIVVDSFMTGSRGLILSTMILMAAFCAYSIFERTTRSRMLVVVMILACGLCVFVTFKAFPTAVEAFLSRANGDSDDVGQRITNSFVDSLIGAQFSGVVGFGAGSTQVACFALRDRLHLGPPAIYPPMAEGEMLRVMLELGIIGFIVWYALRVYFLWLLWRTTRTLRHPMLRHLALAAFLFHALLINGQLITNTTVGVFYWFLAGFAFLLPKLDTPARIRYESLLDRRRRAIRSVRPSPKFVPDPSLF